MKKTEENFGKYLPAEKNAVSAASPGVNPILAKLQRMPLPKDFYSLTGALRFTMTNDALFHIVFEANPVALRSLVSSLLRLPPEKIFSVEVTNPVEFGNTIRSKYFILDLRLLINGTTVLNIEMQARSLAFWKERSVSYLCRSHDGLKKGDSYLDTKDTIHIGIIGFELSPGHPEFYATFHLANDVTHQKYSDKLRISVLQLKYIDIATAEDRMWGLDLWARFFTATTWEEIHMLAKTNPYIASAAETVYRVTEEDRVRIMLEAAEDFERTQRSIELLRQREQLEHEEVLRQRNEELQQKDEELQQKDEALRQQSEALQNAEKENVRLRAELEALKRQR